MLYLQVATQNMKNDWPDAPEILDCGQKTSPASSTSLLLPSGGVHVDKTSWVMGSRKLMLGLRKKRSISTFEQSNKQTLLKYLLFIRCIAIKDSNSLLVHFINKKIEKKQFFLRP